MLKDNIKKVITEQKDRLKQINWRTLYSEKYSKKISTLASHTFSFISSWWRVLLAGIILFLCLYYPLGGWITNNIDRNTDYEINTTNKKQSATAEMAAFIINREVNDKLWTANVPFFFPSYFLDNMPNFQLGMINATSNVVSSLSKRIDSPIINHEQTSVLQKAAEQLKYDGKIWMFSPTNRFTPVPSANTQYRKARKNLIAFNQALNADEIIFYRRPEDLVFILKRINTNLKKSLDSIDNQIREESTSWTDFKADDIFYYNQGKAYAYYLLLKAIGHDYKDILVEKNIYILWTKTLKALEDASKIDAFSIRNAELNSLTAPNHLVYLAYYIEKAQNINKDIIQSLQIKK